MQLIRDSLASPHVETEKSINESNEKFLRQFINVWIALSTVAVLLAVVIFRVERPIISVGMLTFGVLTRLTLAFGHLKPAKLLLVGTLAASVAITPFFINGITSPIVGAWPLVILMAGWLLGSRSACLITGLAVASISALWLIQEFELLVWTVPPRSFGFWWATLAIIILATGALVWHLIANYAAILRYKRELSEQLDSLNAELKEQLVFKADQLEQVDRAYATVRTDYENAYPMLMMASAIPGLAHDMNTPVGNGGMAASALRDQLDEFAKKIEAGTIRKAELNSFIAMTREGLNIIERANAKVGELVGSLKELSIDQASQRRRQFAVITIVEEVLLMLKPSLKEKAVQIAVDVPAHLRMDSFPGPLGQVLGNLVQNTIVHGFDGRDHGKVTVSASEADGSEVVIHIHDDGVGMSEDVEQRAFDPFFTTKEGRGGSGVGLSLSKRIVEEILLGTISVASEIGQGTCFTIKIPKIAS